MIIKEWEQDGYKFQIREVGFDEIGYWLCGYVGVPNEHPMFNNHFIKNSPEIHVPKSFDVHGGVTYVDKSFMVTEKFRDFKGLVIGFDCNHYGDKRRNSGNEFAYIVSDWEMESTYKNQYFVELELERLYEQLKEMEE